MNQKELNEIRRRFRLDKNNISRIYGCYVNNSGEIISYIDESLGTMSAEDAEMYIGFIKKALSGTLGRNLTDIEFTADQVEDSDEHALLMKLRDSALADSEAREEFYKKVIETVKIDESNYLILLVSDSYDVPFKAKDDEIFEDGSTDIFKYIVCCICPVRTPSLAMKFFNEELEFHSSSTGQLVQNPELGFMFPAFDKRSANIYNALFYTKNVSLTWQGFTDAIFSSKPVISIPEQKNIFESSIEDTLENECEFDIMQALHEQMCVRIEDHKESKNPEVLQITPGEICSILKSSGVSEDHAESFREICTEKLGEGGMLNPKNIINDKKFEIKMDEVSISASPKFAHLIETRIIDNRKYVLVPADGEVCVNGIPVRFGAPVDEN